LTAILSVVSATLLLAISILVFSVRLSARNREGGLLGISRWFPPLIALTAVVVIAIEVVLLGQLIATGSRELTGSQKISVSGAMLWEPFVVLAIAALSTFVQWAPWNLRADPPTD